VKQYGGTPKRMQFFADLSVASRHQSSSRADIHQAEREVITAIKFDLCPHSLPAHLLAGVSADIT